MPSYASLPAGRPLDSERPGETSGTANGFYIMAPGAAGVPPKGRGRGGANKSCNPYATSHCEREKVGEEGQDDVLEGFAAMHLHKSKQGMHHDFPARDQLWNTSRNDTACFEHLQSVVCHHWVTGGRGMQPYTTLASEASLSETYFCLYSPINIALCNWTPPDLC